MATLGTMIYTWWKGEPVGEDEFGNRYYQEKGRAEGRWRRRWVVYKGRPEASKVPPDWHAWLHRTINEPPSASPLLAKDWEKTHLPNLTGTKAAYLPQGHVLRGGKRAAATGDYEAWQPEG
ncbi:MAG: NADH:ubiquinone oxidoreductase subunit NDUFA12 [Rhodospirillales bacterium]|nr:NADH:ubiquinone oxidoreductase subunit NDUFA12 [Rhodospirillales bacterium]